MGRKLLLRCCELNISAGVAALATLSTNSPARVTTVINMRKHTHNMAEENTRARAGRVCQSASGERHMTDRPRYDLMQHIRKQRHVGSVVCVCSAVAQLQQAAL